MYNTTKRQLQKKNEEVSQQVATVRISDLGTQPRRSLQTGAMNKTLYLLRP